LISKTEKNAGRHGMSIDDLVSSLQLRKPNVVQLLLNLERLGLAQAFLLTFVLGNPTIPSVDKATGKKLVSVTNFGLDFLNACGCPSTTIVDVEVER